MSELSEFKVRTSNFEAKIALRSLSKMDQASLALAIEMKINETHFEVKLPSGKEVMFGVRLHVEGLDERGKA